MDFVPMIIGGHDENDEPEPEPEIEQDDKLQEEDIFDTPNITIEERVLRDNDDEHGEYEENKIKEDKEEPIISKKTGRPKRKQTEKQKEALKKGRERALVNRRAKAKALKNEKLDTEIDGLNKQLKGKKKQYPFVQKEETIEEEKIEEKPRPKTPINTNRIYSQDDVDNITFQAIKNYDMVKKERKKEKLAKQKIEKEDEFERQKLLNIVKNVKPTDDSAEFWGNCF